MTFLRLGVALALATALPTNIARAGETALVIAAEDTHVLATQPSTSFGHVTELQSGHSLVEGEWYRTFLQFRLPAPARIGTIRRATLRGTFLYRPSSGVTGPQELHFVSDDSWSEASVDWDGQPAIAGTPIASIDVATLSNFQSVAFDVTDLAKQEQAGDRVLSLRIAAPTEGEPVRNGAKWASRENRHYPGFQLELVLDRPQALLGEDLVFFQLDGTQARVVAFDSETRLAKPLGGVELIWMLKQTAVDPRDGSLVISTGTGFPERLVRVDLSTGQVEPIAHLESARTELPGGLTVGPDGMIYLLQDRRVYGVDPSEGKERLLIEDAEHLYFPTAVVSEPTGELLIAAGSSVTWLTGIVRFDPGTGELSPLVSDAQLGYVRSLALDAEGTLWATNNTLEGLEVVRIDLATGGVSVVATLSWPEHTSPGCIAVEPTGTLLVGSCEINLGNPAPLFLERIDPATGFSETVLASTVSMLLGLVAHPTEGMLANVLGGSWNSRIARVDRGVEEIVAAPLNPGYGFHIVVDEQRQLLVTQGESDRVTRVDPITGTQELVSIGEALSPDEEDPSRFTTAMARAPEGTLVALAAGFGSAGSLLVEIDPESGAQKVLASGLPSTVRSVAVEPDGSVLVGTTRFVFRISELRGIHPACGPADRRLHGRLDGRTAHERG